MKLSKINILNYDDACLTDCLRLFEENCPQYFAQNEEQEYRNFLESEPEGYLIVVNEDKVVAAFGLINSSNKKRARLSWILVSASAKGQGIGVTMMKHVQRLASEQKVATIEIAASHLSAPFFAKFGATTNAELPDGWGKGMHRIDMELKLV